MFCSESIKLIFNNINISFSKMEHLDIQSKPCEEITNMSDIPDDLSHKSMAVMENRSIRATTDTEREANSLESDTCHWRDMLKLCTPLSIQLTHLSKDILKKFTVPKRNGTQRLSGSTKNLVMDSRDYRSRKRKKKNVSAKVKYARKKQKTILDKTSHPKEIDENSILKSCTVTSTNDNVSTAPACPSEEHIRSEKIINASAMDKVLDGPISIEHTGKDDTSSVQCLNENTEERTQVEKNNTETEESRYQEYVRNILMEYCYSYGNLSHMSKETNDNENSSDTKSTTGDKRRSNENFPDDQIPSWNSRKRRKKVQLNSKEETIVNRKRPKKKQQQRIQKNFTSTPKKDDQRRSVFMQRTKSPSCTPPAAEQQIGKTGADSPKKLKIQLMKLEDVSGMYAPIESTDMILENERDVSSSMNNDNDSVVGSEGISDAETVVNPMFTEESTNGNEIQESDHALDSIPIIALEKKSGSGSEISDVSTERDLEIVKKQRKTSMSSDEIVHRNNEADNYINEVDEAIDVDAILRLRYGIKKDPVILLEKLNLTHNYASANVYQYDHDVSDVLEESDSSSSDSEIFMFVRKRKSSSVRNRRISSSSEEEHGSSIKPVSTPVSSKDEDGKNRSPISRTTNTREETSEVFVTNQSSSISKDTSLEGSEHVATLVKKKVSQPENTNNLSPKNVVQNPDIIEYNSDSSDSDIQILSVMTMNSNVPPKTCEKIGMNSPSTPLSPKKSLSMLSTDNTGSAVVSHTNETPIVNTQSPVKNTQTPSGSKNTPVSTTPKLSCHICNRKYVRKRSLKIHMELQHNNDPSKFSKPDTASSTTQECDNANECLDCGICSKKFVSKKEFVDHVFNHQSEAQQDYRTAPDKRSRAVWLDLYGLKDKNAEDQHVEKSKKDKKDSSSDKRIRKEEQIISSLTASPKEVVVCPCHPNNGLLNEQGSSVYIEMVLLCEHCNVVFRRKECLETHYRVSAQCSVNRTSGRVPKLYCTACNVTVESLSVLRHHLEMHPRLQVRGIVTFLCNICKVIFFGIGSIFRRHWFSHIKNPLFVASRHSFPKISVMKALENYNVSAEERMQVAQAAELAENIKYVLIAEHVCRNCKLPFGSEADLTNHSTSCSGSKNTSNVTNALNDGTTCSTCQKTFTDKSNYDIHVGKCHATADGSSPEKSKDTTNYSCDICHRTCQTKDQLKLHQNSHSSASLFLCSRCGISFSAVEPFNAHTQVTCTICDKQFDCQKRYQDHLSSHFTNLAISEKPQESSTKTPISCETNLEVDKRTAKQNHVENTEVTVSPGSSLLQATGSAEPHQSKSQTEVRYLIIRDEVTKLPKQVVTITSAGSTSNTSCISKESEQQTSILNEILSINNAMKNVTNIVEAQPANTEKDPLASGEEKDTATTMDTEVPTDSSETSSTTGMPRSSNNEKTPTSGFLRVKSMSELLEKRDKKSYICKTCGLPCTSAENLTEHSNTHDTHQVTNEKRPPSVNGVQRIVDQDSLRLLNQYITSNKLILQPIRSNITNASSNNFNTEMTTNISNTQQANNEGICGNASAFTPCVICGTVFNATENPIHCQTATTSTGQVNTHTNARVYQPVANNQRQSIENASTFNTAVRHSPFVTYTSNTIGREPPVSAVNSVNVNLNMNQQVTQPPPNSQWTNLTYDTTNVPIVHSQVPSRLPPPYSAPTNIHSNTLPKNMNGTTTAATINSHCIVPNPPTRPQYPYRAVSQSGNKSVVAKPPNSSFSSSTSFTSNNTQPITTDAPIGSTRPSGYSMNYGVLNVPLQQSQSDIFRTESHVTRKPAHQSISQTLHHLPEQPSQPESQPPAQLCNFINQPKTTQTYQQTSQQTTREQPCMDLSSRPIFTCPSCKDFTCTTAEELKLHRIRHTKQQPIQPSKSYCTSTSDVEPRAHSSLYSSITNQQARPASNEPLYVCNKCHIFRTTSHVELEEHMKQHHRSYICQLCHIYKCKSATQMQDHINLHIDGKIAPHAVRHTLELDGKVVSKNQTSQLPSSSFSETSHSAGVRSSSVHQTQPTQVRSKQYSKHKFRSNGDSQVLDHKSNTDTLNSCSKKQTMEQSGFKKTVYYFCKVCKPTPVFQTVAELERHQASLHP